MADINIKIKAVVSEARQAIASVKRELAGIAPAAKQADSRRRWGLMFVSARFASSGERPVRSAIRAIDTSVIFVSTQPGHTALTVTPDVAISIASARVSPTMACLEAQYAVLYA